MTYGRNPSDDAHRRRKFIHEHIVAQRLIPHALPTNVRAVYYVGKGSAWPADSATEIKPGKTTAKVPSQHVSHASQWLIDHGLVDETEIVDEGGGSESALGVTNLLDYVLRRAKSVALDPWAPLAVPVLIAEGRNDMALLRPIMQDRLIHVGYLEGMAGRGRLRRIFETIDPFAPVGYVGDWNKAGRDIERNAEEFLKARGWDGEWKRLLITEDQIRTLGLTEVPHYDKRSKAWGSSVETASMPVGDSRAVIHDWLDSCLPKTPSADDSKRGAIVGALEALR